MLKQLLCVAQVRLDIILIFLTEKSDFAWLKFPYVYTHVTKANEDQLAYLSFLRCLKISQYLF
jgi:hypothetical protein